MGRKELGLPYLPVEERCLFEVPVGFSFTSKEPELLLGCAGWNGRRNIFPRQELVGKETVSPGEGKSGSCDPSMAAGPTPALHTVQTSMAGAGHWERQAALWWDTFPSFPGTSATQGQGNINFYKDME